MPEVIEYASAEVAAHGIAGLVSLVVIATFAACCIYLASWITKPPPQDCTLPALEKQVKKNDKMMLVVVILFIVFVVLLSLGAVPFAEG